MGRFLEHSRVYFFQNGKIDPIESDYFIGSADWMFRNLNNRFEVIAPILNSKNRKKLWNLLQVNLEDLSTSWQLSKNGKYTHRKSKLPESKIIASATHLRLLSEN
jgi:polyphosphate kinase